MRRLLIFAALISTLTATAQGSYDDIVAARRANRGIGALRSTADGEHYTVNASHAILRRAYTDATDKVSLVECDFRIADYALSPDEKTILLSDASSVSPIYRHSATADYYLAPIGGEPRKILSQVRDASFSPDGTTICYSQGNNLYLYNIKEGCSHAVTTDGEWNSIINGTSDWVYEEEYGFTKAYAFSPDGSRLAYLRFDESLVPTFEMMRYDGTLHNRAYSFKYPKAGERNSTVEVWLYDIASATAQQIPTGDEDDKYITTLRWTPSGDLSFYRINRLQNHFEVVLHRTNGEQRVIYSERSPRYVERPDASTITFIDSDRFIVREESTAGHTHLYLHSIAKGRIRALTSGNWEVTGVVATTDKRVYYLSTERSPLGRDLYAVQLDARKKCRLTQGEGFHTILPSQGMRYYVNTFSSAETPSIVTVHRGNGAVIDTLVDSRAAVAKVGTWSKKEFSTFVTERGDTLNYYIQLPRNFDPSRQYPLLLTQYSGPGSQQVRNRWGLDWEDALVEHGYIVACCDPRGTGYRGEEFKKCTYGQLGHLEVEDQLSFARMLQSLPYIDPQRIGIYGWSYGGFMALNCAFHGEGLFRMAIAVAPVTSWRYYDSIYTEIYNSLPQTNGEGYDLYSPLGHATKLSDRTRLLIIHGTADDNVHFQNTVEICRELNREGKLYDMMIYPDQNHSMLPDCTTAIRKKMLEYTLGNL